MAGPWLWPPKRWSGDRACLLLATGLTEDECRMLSGMSDADARAWAAKRALAAIEAFSAEQDALTNAGNARLSHLEAAVTFEREVTRECCRMARDNTKALLAPLRAPNLLSHGGLTEAPPTRVVEMAVERIEADRREIDRLRTANVVLVKAAQTPGRQGLRTRLARAEAELLKAKAEVADTNARASGYASKIVEYRDALERCNTADERTIALVRDACAVALVPFAGTIPAAHEAIPELGRRLLSQRATIDRMINEAHDLRTEADDARNVARQRIAQLPGISTCKHLQAEVDRLTAERANAGSLTDGERSRLRAFLGRDDLVHGAHLLADEVADRGSKLTALRAELKQLAAERDDLRIEVASRGARLTDLRAELAEQKQVVNQRGERIAALGLEVQAWESTAKAVLYPLSQDWDGARLRVRLYEYTLKGWEQAAHWEREVHKSALDREAGDRARTALLGVAEVLGLDLATPWPNIGDRAVADIKALQSKVEQTEARRATAQDRVIELNGHAGDLQAIVLAVGAALSVPTTDAKAVSGARRWTVYGQDVVARVKALQVSRDSGWAEVKRMWDFAHDIDRALPPGGLGEDIRTRARKAGEDAKATVAVRMDLERATRREAKHAAALCDAGFTLANDGSWVKVIEPRPTPATCSPVHGRGVAVTLAPAPAANRPTDTCLAA